MKRTIIYIIDGLNMGGAERLMIHILRHLDRDEFEPRVCVLQEKEGNPVAQDVRGLGVPVDWMPVHRMRDVTAVPRLTRYLRRVGADLVHTQLEFANVLGTLAAKFAGLPAVCTIHVLPSDSSRPKTRLHNGLEGFILRTFCDRVIAVSEEARLLHVAATGARASQVVTLYNGIELGLFSASGHVGERLAVRQELRIPESAPVLLTVAVLRPEKGIQYMIRALPSIMDMHPDVNYLVVGGGPYLNTLQEEARNDRVRRNIIFTGMRTDIPRLMAAADLFVLPTLTEALPTVLMEAMASGLPIVASAVGGIPEMVEDGRSGRLVPPQDVEALAAACNALLGDPRARLEMGKLGGQIADQKFSIQGQVERLQEIYREEISPHER